MFFAKKCIIFLVICVFFLIFASHTKKQNATIMLCINRKKLWQRANTDRK